MLSAMQHTIAIATTPADIEGVRRLFVEYQAWLGDLVCSQRLTDEIASLPAPYADPSGVLLVARALGTDPVGCVGVCLHEGTTAEMKRLYVRPEGRNAGLGRRLAERAVEEAATLGYSRLVLSTIPAAMAAAVRLYESLGFRETGPFRDHGPLHAEADMVYLELDLRSS